MLCGFCSTLSDGVAASGDRGRGQDSSAAQPHLQLPSPHPCATVRAEPEITETWQVGNLRAQVGTPVDAGDRQVTVSVTASACGGRGTNMQPAFLKVVLGRGGGGVCFLPQEQDHL